MNIFSILKDLYYKGSSARFIDYLKMGEAVRKLN